MAELASCQAASSRVLKTRDTLDACRVRRAPRLAARYEIERSDEADCRFIAREDVEGWPGAARARRENMT